jgi:hypothetical protein
LSGYVVPLREDHDRKDREGRGREKGGEIEEEREEGVTY